LVESGTYDTLRKEFVEIEIVVSKELQATRLFKISIVNLAYLELQDSAIIYGGVLKHVKVEWSARVHLVGLVPYEGSDTHLEGVHPTAVVLQLLISVLHCVVVVLPVVVAHVQAYKSHGNVRKSFSGWWIPENSVSKPMNSAAAIDSLIRGIKVAKFSLVTSILYDLLFRYAAQIL
jgi:hypothetical protein